MARKRRPFTPELKQEAAFLVLDQGYTIAEASRSLGVAGNALRRWIKQLSEERGGVTPKSKAMMPEQQRIHELEARCERLEREKSILKSYRSLDVGRVVLRVDVNRIFRKSRSSAGSRMITTMLNDEGVMIGLMLGWS